MWHTLNKIKKGNNINYGIGGSKKKKNLLVIDLNANTNADASTEAEETGLTHRELQFVESLKLEYSNYPMPKCASKTCKINKNSKHVHLSWQQLWSWASALVSSQGYGFSAGTQYCIGINRQLRPMV